jgi:hypothetical protein
MPNRILLAYKAYGAVGMDRLGKALDVQKKYVLVNALDKLLVTDATTEVDIPGVHVLRTEKTYDLTNCNFSRMRNMSIEHADKYGYTHILMLDSDSIVTAFKEVRSDRFFTRVIPDPTLSMSTRAYPYGWYLIPRKIFNLKWDERYIGWGWEDVDYQNNILRANGCVYYHGGVTGDHMDHPMQKETAPEWTANKKLYYENQGKIPTSQLTPIEFPPPVSKS